MQAELTQPALLSPAPGRWSRSTTSNEEAARALLAAENPDPQSRIGGGNADPFDSLSYPLVMNAADHQLLHHCKYLCTIDCFSSYRAAATHAALRWLRFGVDAVVHGL